MNWTTHYKKAVTFSYDDGVVPDLKLLEIFNKYGIKCTFNLNYGLGPENGNWDRIEKLCQMLAGRDDIFYGTNAEVLL